MEFGKNRIQYEQFVWTYLDYERYRVYSYQGGNELARYVSVSAAKQLTMLEKRLDYILEDKLNILVYNNQGDFKQSNLGLNNDEQTTNVGGVTHIIGDKISIFFNGSLSELDRQIRATLAELLINKMLYDGNAREMVRNSAVLNMPEWYVSGLVKYLSEGWTSYNDNLLYDDLKNDSYNRFNHLTGKRAAQAGHALWYHIIYTFGESVIPNLLYMTRIQRNPDNAFITTLGLTMQNLIYDFTEAYNRRLYMFRDTLRKSPIRDNKVLKRYKATKHYYGLKVNPDGNQVVYATNELNQMRVYLRDVETGKQHRIFKYSPKIEQLPDYNYPLLAFHPTGKLVAMIYERKNQLVMQTYDVESGESMMRNLPGFEKINSFSYSNDGKKLAMSAVKKGKGQSDVFVFTINSSSIEQLTNDIWDDNNPVFVKNSKQIVFESNRVNDTIKSSDDAQYFNKLNRNMDLFMAEYPFNSSKVLVRVTNTPDVNETQPQAYTSRYVTFLSDKNGIYNRYLAEYDSVISFVDTTEHYRYFFATKVVSNGDRNILEQSINENATHVAEVIYAKGNNMLLLSPLEKLNGLNMPEPENTWFKGLISPAITDPANYKEPPKYDNSYMLQPSENTKKGIDFDNYKFSGEKDKANDLSKSGGVAAKQDTLNKKSTGDRIFRFPVSKNYYTTFYRDYVVTQFDNSFLGNNYQVFSGGGSPVYLNPGFNFLTKMGVSDLFEDRRIVGAFRINPSIDNEFMLAYELRKKLIDHQFVLNRQSFNHVPAVSADGNIGYDTRVNTSTAKYTLKYPFNPAASVRFSLLYRNDHTTPLSGGDYSLPKKPEFQNMAGTRVEYVFDNTRKVMLNIMNGFRGKVWVEYWQLPEKGNKNLITSGFDLRHYQKVHRQITWCNRVAGGNSLGSNRLIFYLGGVDNAILPRFNSNVSISNPEQYGFQTLATDMRGFYQNTRNGNNFVLYNSELRIPLIRYLSTHPLRSDFFNNFQIIPFFDLGTAWTGNNPLAISNIENVQTYVDNDPLLGTGGSGIIIKVIDYKNPLVGSTGFGVASRLLGYFVRLDVGWGIDNMTLQRRVFHFSFTTNF
ncbi:MAG: PD40 domain-containing protein [Bacteroidetes bacterium]|nr:PD40 domain-containing protein [Bacteroidota bacterium]